jgi:xanthine/CO dehydrogenase XdhC/CoxF family maturation factor
VFGAGQDAVPLVRQAWTLGFEVTVVDPRGAYLQESLFTGARLVLTAFDDLADLRQCAHPALAREMTPT